MISNYIAAINGEPFKVASLDFENKLVYYRNNENELVNIGFEFVTLLKYSRLEDRNGREIYDNDIYIDESGETVTIYEADGGFGDMIEPLWNFHNQIEVIANTYIENRDSIEPIYKKVLTYKNEWIKEIEATQCLRLNCDRIISNADVFCDDCLKLEDIEMKKTLGL